METLKMLAVFVVLFASFTCIRCEDCIYNGESYPEGTNDIPSVDGCNSCFCDAGGVSCTEIGCIDSAPCSREDGTVIRHGDRGLDDKGCNECLCENGKLTDCTEKACLPDNSGSECIYNGESYPEGTNDIPSMDGCNTCFCDAGGVSCTEIGCIDMAPCSRKDGTVIRHGDKGLDDEDCNECRCDNGQLTECTEKACQDTTGNGATGTCAVSSFLLLVGMVAFFTGGF